MLFRSRASVAVATDGHPDAVAVVRQIARHVEGGGGGSPQLALAGGRDPAGLDGALGEARELLRRA